jgi:uncharacterized protein YjiS (DUF1127 family)
MPPFNVEGKIMNRITWNEKMELSQAVTPAGDHHAIGLKAVGHFGRQVAGALRRSLTRMAIERELSALDDRSLADIGVIRANIGAVAAQAAGEPDLGTAFVHMLGNAILVPFKLWRERSRTENDLSRLSDRELLDIGVSRADIQAIVRSVSAKAIQAPAAIESGDTVAPTPATQRPLQEVGVVRGDIEWLASAVARKAADIANRNRPSAIPDKGMRPNAA